MLDQSEEMGGHGLFPHLSGGWRLVAISAQIWTHQCHPRGRTIRISPNSASEIIKENIFNTVEGNIFKILENIFNTFNVAAKFL